MVYGAPQTLIDNLIFPEGPRWHDGRLWFSDIHAGEVVTVDLHGQRETVGSVPGKPSGLGFLPDGRALIVSMEDRKLLRLERDGGLVVHADLSALAAFCNDMIVDQRGNAYVGDSGYAAFAKAPYQTGKLILVTPDGAARVVAEDLAFPNGTVITPDGQTLILGETVGRRLTAFDLALDGSLDNRRVWAELGLPPDGICLDAEGCVWVASPRAPGRFVRVAEGGEVRDRVEVDDFLPIACALGGAERKTLFLLEARTTNRDEMAGRANGRIRVMEVKAPGAGYP